MELTESMEDYLRLVYELGLDGKEVGRSALARRLGRSDPSATNMAKRLAKAGLIRRAPYRGLILTEEGRKAVPGVVRRHRLVELVSEELVDRMEKLLGHPEGDSHGAPIPAKDGEVVERLDIPLAGLGVGETPTLPSSSSTSKLHDKSM